MDTQARHHQGKPSSRGKKQRQDLILAAYRLLSERGFEGLRVREVAASTGINSATLHYYFPTKKDLVQAVGEYIFQQFLSVTAPVPEGYHDTPEQQMLQVFRDMQYQLEHVPDLFVVLNELHLHAHHDPAVQTLLQRLNDGWQAHLVSICRTGIQQHVFRADLDAHQFASTVIALLKGISLQVGSHLDTFDVERIGIEALHTVIRPSKHLSLENERKISHDNQ